MIIGICKILYHFPYAGSLKEKRRRLNSMKGILRKKFNISISEIDYQNYWQKTILGIAVVNNDKKILDRIFYKIIEDIEKLKYGYINDYNVEFLHGEIA
ncbi:MAG: DUF503 domain-containing protein [Spirochaetes bacterium]|nr:DUF503 domain-containing protein [Spirochaetota bacterium]